MSRAFVKEPDGDGPPEALPEIPIPPPPNPVTRRGLGLIEATLLDLETRIAAASAPEELMRLRRDQRYWLARRASAALTPPPTDPEEVGFGSQVRVRWPDRGAVDLEIVGEDESDPEHGRLSWRAPVALALTGNGVGDLVEVRPDGSLTLEILAVDNRPERPGAKRSKP